MSDLLFFIHPYCTTIEKIAFLRVLKEDKLHIGACREKNDHRRTRTCNLLVPLAIEAKRATIAPGSLTKVYCCRINGAYD